MPSTLTPSTTTPSTLTPTAAEFLALVAALDEPLPDLVRPLRWARGLAGEEVVEGRLESLTQIADLLPFSVDGWLTVGTLDRPPGPGYFYAQAMCLGREYAVQVTQAHPDGRIPLSDLAHGDQSLLSRAEAIAVMVAHCQEPGSVGGYAQSVEWY
ncbi:hypothetical protein [Xylanimonas ulmi]|uniref:Uncharacterized protein n=1 Tax=Xylanimonas ulmi TaxID=228973 RepID=A0A4Q7M2X4_9MICO|nr:hypothetical protein [Xylanibacterium ulmi]RZS62256.1 hypothetical protein EV386_2581 [Xylanibacterium ulmi]